jgi:lipopolysaccharide assembly outer membrane protein LptD (OstA)
MSGAAVATRWCGGVVAAVLVARLAVAGSVPLEVRVSSSIAENTTTVRLAADPTARVEPPLTGSAFTGDIVLRLTGVRIPRVATIEVTDPLVSQVTLRPDDHGGRVVMFVRRPVTYAVERTAAGIVVRVRGTTPPPATEHEPARRQAAVRTRGAPEVTVDAESLAYDKHTDTITAHGSVTLTRGDTSLQADEVRYDRREQRATASGRVTLTDPELTLLGNEAELDLDDETGWVTAGQAEFKQSRYVVDAERVDKRGGPHYHVSDGVFTTCRCGGLDRPSWSLACQETDLSLGSYGWVRGATFRLKDIPVLYLPILVFPATTERQTGLLVPRFGYSNRRGFQWEQPFFWAIDKSSDATLAFDLETAARVGAIGEYRYVWSRKASGVFAGALFDESLRSQADAAKTPIGNLANVPTQRFALAGRHDQPGPLGSQAYVDLFAVSDDLFLREINNFSSSVEGDLRIRSTRFTRSRAGVLRTWDRSLVQLESTYYQDLIDPQELAIQSLPRLDVEHGMPLLGNTVLGRIRGQVADFVRDSGYDGVRAEVAPEVFAPFHLGPYLNGSVRGLVREQLYYLNDRSRVALAIPDDLDIRSRFLVAGPHQLAPLDRWHDRPSAEVNAEIGTRVARSFDFDHFGFDRLRHTIEPTVQFLYVPPVSQTTAQFRLPSCTDLYPNDPAKRELARGRTCAGRLFSEGYLFDEEDAINRRTFLSYGITTRLFGRRTTPAPSDPDGKTPIPEAPRELLRASVLHGVDTSRNLTNGRQTSDLDLALRFTPTSALGIAYRTTLSVDNGSVLGQWLGLSLREPADPTWAVGQAPSGVRVGYRFVAAEANGGLGLPESRLFQNRNAGLEEVSGGAYLRLGRYMGIALLARYDLADAVAGPHFLERSLSWRILSRCNCWALDVGVTDRYDTNEKAIRVQFTLVGLGAIGRRPTLHNYVGVGALTPIDEAVDENVGGPWQ